MRAPHEAARSVSASYRQSFAILASLAVLLLRRDACWVLAASKISRNSSSSRARQRSSGEGY